jgi:hypothetical protein
MDDKETCEHVSFHEALRWTLPHSPIWIQPKFLNDGPWPTLFEYAQQHPAKRFESEWKTSFQNPDLDKYYQHFYEE